MLTSISMLPNLTRLDCFDCPITSIPMLPNLTRLDCFNCRILTSIPMLPNLTRLECSGCQWVINNNADYNSNITHLIVLQKWSKKMLLANALVRRSVQIASYWYHPCAHGGYFHKKRMLKDLMNM
jgi:hypothetical protein